MCLLDLEARLVFSVLLINCGLGNPFSAPPEPSDTYPTLQACDAKVV